MRSTCSSAAVSRAQETAGPSSGSRACAQLLVGADRGPLLGQYDQAGAVRRGGACETIGGGEVRAEVGGGVDLDGRCLHL